MLLSVHSENHTIHFNENAYQELYAFLASASYTKIFILVDANTYRFCWEVFVSHLRRNYILECIEIKADESHKNIATCLQVWKTLAEKGADRKSVLINLGGGVVTDLGGFVASTYMRGMDFIHVPTSLLAMVDASIGGKTGVDLGALKNLVGVINVPKMIVIDTSFLETLPENQLRSGFAEMLKHGLIYDERYWDTLSEYAIATQNDLNELIHESVKIKNAVVMQDLREQGLRKILNYGHTLGHAIESYFLNTKKQLLHGEAIAIGMVLATYISHRVTAFPKTKLRHIKKVIRTHFNRVNFMPEDYREIIRLLKYDKKNTYGRINFVLLEDIGVPVLDQSVPEALILEAFEYYWE